MNNIPTAQPLSPQEAYDYKVSLLLNINTLLLNLISINNTNPTINNIFLTRLHGNIKFLIMMGKASVDIKTLDLSHIPQVNMNDIKVNQTISALNKYYLLFTKLVELYPWPRIIYLSIPLLIINNTAYCSYSCSIYWKPFFFLFSNENTIYLSFPP